MARPELLHEVPHPGVPGRNVVPESATAMSPGLFVLMLMSTASIGRAGVSMAPSNYRHPSRGFGPVGA